MQNRRSHFLLPPWPAENGSPQNPLPKKHGSEYWSLPTPVTKLENATAPLRLCARPPDGNGEASRRSGRKENLVPQPISQKRSDFPLSTRPEAIPIFVRSLPKPGSLARIPFSSAESQTHQLNWGASATRNPRKLIALSGLPLARSATRQLLAPPYQLPPRSTRLKPDPGPTGSRCDVELYSPYQSQHHSHTFPLMS